MNSGALEPFRETGWVMSPYSLICSGVIANFWTVTSTPLALRGSFRVTVSAMPVGGPGNDGVLGGRGSDNVSGEAGDDWVADGPDREFSIDRLSAGDGNDVVGAFNDPASKEIGRAHV